MKLSDVVARLDLEVRTAGARLEQEVTGGYASDLLSDVLANSSQGNLWITLQTHHNIVAVAALKELAGIALVNAREPEADTLRKAEEEGIPIVVSRLPAFELIGRLFDLGLRGGAAQGPEGPQ